VLEIRELIRRLQLDETDRQIARDLQVSRKTVRKYRRWAQQHDVLTAPLPDAATLQAQLKTTLPASPPPMSTVIQNSPAVVIENSPPRRVGLESLSHG